MTIAPVASVFAEDIKVAMVTDYGDINDQSFNQNTYEACKYYCDENGVEFTYYKPEGDSTADRAAMIDMAVANGYNVVVLPGFSFAEAIIEEADMYPDLKFVALDISQDDLDAASGETGYTRENVYSAAYREELSGYMAGYAAVKLGFKKLGFLGGMAVPGVMRFGYGYVQGADDAAKESACEAAEKTGGKVIGVDVDQSGLISANYEEGMCVTSALKGLFETVMTLLGGIQNDHWADFSGKVEKLGLVSAETEGNYVGLPATTAFNDDFTADDYAALVAAMFNGEVEVSDDTSAEEPTAETITINFQGNLK